MQKIGIFILICILGQNTFSATLTQKLLQSAISFQCQQELKTSKIWKVASGLISTENKTVYQDNVCGCVSEYALKDMNTKAMAIALVNEQEKNRLIRKAVINSLKGCIKKVLE